MDKYEATKLLTEKLVEHLGRLTVCDENYQKKLLGETQHAYVVGNYVEAILNRDYNMIWYTKNYGQKGTKGNTLEDVIQESIPKEANYLFASVGKKLNDCRVLVTVTPYSIIGGREIEAIQSLFYKAYNAQIREAIHTLDIKDFFELYNIYSDTTPEEFLKLFFSSFEKFKKELLDFLGSLKYDSDDDAMLNQFGDKFGIQELNSQLEKFQVDFIFPLERNYIHKTLIDGLASLLQRHNPPTDWEGESVLKFVFALPYEDQNLEINKLFLQKFSPLLDVNNILLKEYQQGKYFKEYFELLDLDKKKEITRLVKHSEIENKDCNAFLWSQGFKDVGMDYLKLYREDHDVFIEYFNSRSKEGKKAILEEILEYDHMNHKVIEWLDTNEPELIKEAGLSKK